MKKQVDIPSWLTEGVKPLKNSYPKNPNLLVFDTETEEGKPYFLHFYDGEKPTYIKVSVETILHEFMNYLLEHCNKKHSNILFAHNLEFDLGAVLSKFYGREDNPFLWRNPNPIIVYESDEHKKKMGRIKLFIQKTWFAQIKLRNNAYVKVVDSTNFIKGSLYKLSRELDLEHKKSGRPYFVSEGRKPENQREWDMLLRYCGREIKTTYDLAEYISNIHKKYDTSFSVSTPHLGSKIFRKHFLHSRIPQIPDYIRKLAEYTIHGGRADTFTHTPTVIPNVKMYDFNSFYPYAMVQLPPFTEGKWEKTQKFVNDYEGFYRVTGYVHKCKYPILIKSLSRMEYANNENIVNVPVTSYELRESLRNNEIDIKKIRGYIWIPTENSSNPFKDYVEHFYRLKNETKENKPVYLSNKLLLNAVYGKTYQAIRQTDYQEEPEYILDKQKNRVTKNKIKYRAGGLYLPHLGSWITSMCRAILHQNLHQYEALDCATDSFKTTKTVLEGEKLGDLKLVCEGLLLLIKPKLYVMFSKETQKEIMNYGSLREWLQKNLETIDIWNDNRIVKYALHGFWGNIKQLLELYRDEKHNYTTKHMTRIKESIKQNKYPRIMETLQKEIHVDWKKEKGLCGIPKKQAYEQKEMCNLQCLTCAYNQTT